ncbi:hypothetical protein F4803DRAFT_284872 [Xylaria telfairii]|nr:hypothetical protein F4803DRAFT_284872 [Xylaria telfairii]
MILGVVSQMLACLRGLGRVSAGMKPQSLARVGHFTRDGHGSLHVFLRRRRFIPGVTEEAEKRSMDNPLLAQRNNFPVSMKYPATHRSLISGEIHRVEEHDNSFVKLGYRFRHERKDSLRSGSRYISDGGGPRSPDLGREGELLDYVMHRRTWQNEIRSVSNAEKRVMNRTTRKEPWS